MLVTDGLCSLAVRHSVSQSVSRFGPCDNQETCRQLVLDFMGCTTHCCMCGFYNRCAITAAVSTVNEKKLYQWLGVCVYVCIKERGNREIDRERETKEKNAINSHLTASFVTSVYGKSILSSSCCCNTYCCIFYGRHRLLTVECHLLLSLIAVVRQCSCKLYK